MATKLRFWLLMAGVPVFFASSTPQLLNTQEILQLVNQDRAEHGLPALNDNPTLTLAALAKAQDMLSRNYFAHSSPDGTKPWHWFTALGYNYAYAGENLAEGFTNADDLENSWMSSPTHRANILSPFYSDIGLAVLRENNTNIVVQFFGSKEDKVVIRN